MQGKKLSKSNDNTLELRNKSYSKVLDMEIDWIRAVQEGSPNASDLKVKWQRKSEWHHKEFGW